MILAALAALTLWLSGCATDSANAKAAADFKMSLRDATASMASQRMQLVRAVETATTPEARAKAEKALAAFDKIGAEVSKASAMVETSINDDGTPNAAGIAMAAAAVVPQPYGALAGLGVSIIYGVVARQRARDAESERLKKAQAQLDKAKAEADAAVGGGA